MAPRVKSSNKSGKPIRSRQYADQVVATLEKFRASRETLKAARTAAKRSR